jgi:hypothetical protein
MKVSLTELWIGPLVDGQQIRLAGQPAIIHFDREPKRGRSIVSRYGTVSTECSGTLFISTAHVSLLDGGHI